MTEEDFIKIINEYVVRKKLNPYWNCNYHRPIKTKAILQRLNK